MSANDGEILLISVEVDSFESLFRGNLDGVNLAHFFTTINIFKIIRIKDK
jgi:hypothetical protein